MAKLISNKNTQTDYNNKFEVETMYVVDTWTASRQEKHDPEMISLMIFETPWKAEKHNNFLTAGREALLRRCFLFTFNLFIVGENEKLLMQHKHDE